MKLKSKKKQAATYDYQHYEDKDKKKGEKVIMKKSNEIGLE